ncbi:helix-turn-helix domain-containing protein [Metabacillus fastidiosus]|uniref:helix-turn-helix domain-containing protein n=1 Tax=Metabacillus fastidiosus TaxID=1458 RepID=UPI002E242884
MSNEFNLLTLQEAMDLLQISRSTINRWRKDKGLPVIKVGKDVFVDKNQLQKWVRSHTYIKNQPVKPAIETITIGYQSMNAHLWSSLIIKELHLFEEELQKIHPNHPIKIQWADLNGPQQIEGMLTGRIQIASLGDFPLVSLYQLSSLLPSFQPRLLAFDGKNTHNEGFSLVIPKKSNLRMDQISNHTIATLSHSSSWHRLYKAFQSERINPTIISQDSLENMNNILSNQVDATTMIEPFLSMITHLELGKKIQLEGCEDDYLTGIVAEGQWASQHADIVIAYLKAHLRAHHLIRNNPFKIAKIISQHINFPIQVVSIILSKIRWDAAIYDRDVLTLSNIGQTHHPVTTKWMDNLFDTNKLRNCFVNDSYLQEAAIQLKLPMMNSSILSEDWIANQIF